MDLGPFVIQDDLTLKFSEDGHVLLAEFPASKDRHPIKLAWLHEKLKELGLDQLKLNQTTIGQCLKQYNGGVTTTAIGIAERIDAELSIKVSDDLMTAYLSISPAAGGQSVTGKVVSDHLEEQDINTGIDKQTIDDALQSQQAHDALVARGQLPVDGKDGYFESLIPDLKDRRPRIDDKGVAHYNDISELVTVKPGDPLVHRRPPTAGQPGKNVKGGIIEPAPGQDMMYASNLPGTEHSPQNPHVLQASICGQPILVENGAIVEPTVTVQDVDMSSGNIEFDGTVIILGNVTTGMKVKAQGDINVHGMVEAAAIIEAGGDIIVHNGVIGRGSIADEESQPGHGIVLLRSAHDISARFIENTRVVAQNTVNITELIAHCDVTANNQVIVGGKNAKRGHIMGGITQAQNLVQAQVLGSPGSVNTKIEVGVSPEHTKNLADTTQTLAVRQSEQAVLEKSASYACQTRSDDVNSKKMRHLRRLQATLKTLVAEVRTLDEQRQTYQAEVDRLRQAKIIASRTVFNGVEVFIFNTHSKISDDKGSGEFHLEDKTLLFEPR